MRATARAAAAYCPVMAHDIDPRQEAELVRRARWGNQAAFAELYALHARAVHGLAYRLLGDAAAAEDVTQDVFLKMLQFLGGFRDDAPLRPWLKRVAANAAIDRLRRERADRLDAAEDALPDPHAEPVTHAEAIGLLRRLPPLARTLVWLHEMEGWSHQELADRFGHSPSWSKSIVSRGLNRLRDELEGEHPHGDERSLEPPPREPA